MSEEILRVYRLTMNRSSVLAKKQIVDGQRIINYGPTLGGKTA
jgi:hypothetical protein